MSDAHTDWKRLRQMSEAQIEHNALADPDAQPTTKAMWDQARVVLPDGEPRQMIAIRVSQRVLRHFRKNGRGYQSRINAVLESYVDQQERA